MKKVIISNGIISSAQRKNSFLSRSDIKIFSVATLQDALSIHRSVQADIIIVKSRTKDRIYHECFQSVREKELFRECALIVVAPKTSSAALKTKKRCIKEVYFGKVKGRRIIKKAMQLLNLSWRETYRVLLNVAVEGSACETSFACRSINISVTGMLLETAQKFTKGQRISCSFVLPDTTRIETAGEIVRMIPQLSDEEKKLYGVRFDNMDEETRSKIIQFINPLSEKNHG